MNTKTLIEKYPILRSSADPKQMSMTIQGVLTAVFTILSLVGVIPADAVKDISPITDTIVTGIQGVLSGISAVLTTFGALRKVYYKWFKK